METKWVIFDDVEDGFRGIYETEADAIEMLYDLLEEYAYEVMMTEEPIDVRGGEDEEWNWHDDWMWLMTDAWRTFRIEPVICFG